MNTRYYGNYIANTDYYKNLKSALSIIDEVIKDIDGLKMALDDASGAIITEIVNDLRSLINELSSYSEKITLIIRDLETNASIFDDIYEKWQMKVGTIYEEGYYYNDKFFSTITDDMLMDYYHPKGAKYKVYIDSVRISEADNRVHIKLSYNFVEYEKKTSFLLIYRVQDLFDESNNLNITHSEMYDAKLDFDSNSFIVDTTHIASAYKM